MIVFHFSVRLNIVKLLSHPLYLFTFLLTYNTVTLLTSLLLSPSDIASLLCLVAAICDIVPNFKKVHATCTYEHGREKHAKGARLGFDRLALGLQLDLSVEVR